MSEFTLTDVNPACESALYEGVYLVLLNAVKIPPHLSLLVDGKLYSLETKGATNGGELDALLRVIQRKQLPSLFIQLRDLPVEMQPELATRASAIVQQFDAVTVDGATCLAPMRQWCSEIFGLDLAHVQFIFDLLPALAKKSAVGSTVHLQMEPHLNADRSFRLLTYTLEDIYASVRKREVKIR